MDLHTEYKSHPPNQTDDVQPRQQVAGSLPWMNRSLKAHTGVRPQLLFAFNKLAGKQFALPVMFVYPAVWGAAFALLGTRGLMSIWCTRDGCCGKLKGMSDFFL